MTKVKEKEVAAKAIAGKKMATKIVAIGGDLGSIDIPNV